MKITKYYIGERSNPQLEKSYYIAYGQLTKKEAAKKQMSLYGSLYLTSYDNLSSFEEAKSKIIESGFRLVNN
jgi:hypothetical protein